MVANAVGTILQLARRVLASVFGADTWDRWMVLLTAAFGLPLDDAQLVTFTELTGRSFAPSSAGIRIRETWFIIGRRAGKSIIAALVAVYLTTCRTYTLAPGEVGVFMVIAADRRQARVVKRYISGLLRAASVLATLIEKETADAIYLTNGLVIEIHTASFRTLRGYTVVGAVCDEIAFWPTDDSASPDTEILAALRPAMASVPEALLLCLTSPYARRGETWKAYTNHFGKDLDPVLVVKAPTRALNPLVSQEMIDAAYLEDASRASAEYGAEFRRDVEALISREAVEAVVVAGRRELPAAQGEIAVVDVAGGGGGDSFTWSTARQDGERGILCMVREVRPPFSPEATVEECALSLRARGLNQVYGDKYAGEWPREQFSKHGILYEPLKLTKSDLYRELLPLLNSQQVELLDEPRLIAQLLGLERRVARSGKDSIDHGPHPQCHDDVINAAAGAIVLAIGIGGLAGAGMLAHAGFCVAAHAEAALAEPDHAVCLAAGGKIEIAVDGRCKRCQQIVDTRAAAQVTADNGNPWITGEMFDQ